ncbi:hypothetical protein MNV49_006545 [Pseudohyphozyma bogoriensis]|nr:hypothetical protein MNV49_006545 [Pseudohyphozyma bogoriensis]
MLPTLPPELLSMILQSPLLTPTDLSHCCLVSHAFHALAQRALYATVSLTVVEDRPLDSSENQPLARITNGKLATRFMLNPGLVELVRTLEVHWDSFKGAKRVKEHPVTGRAWTRPVPAFRNVVNLHLNSFVTAQKSLQLLPALFGVDLARIKRLHLPRLGAHKKRGVGPLFELLFTLPSLTDLLLAPRIDLPPPPTTSNPVPFLLHTLSTTYTPLLYPLLSTASIPTLRSLSLTYPYLDTSPIPTPFHHLSSYTSLLSLTLTISIDYRHTPDPILDGLATSLPSLTLLQSLFISFTSPRSDDPSTHFDLPLFNPPRFLQAFPERGVV